MLRHQQLQNDFKCKTRAPAAKNGSERLPALLSF